MRYFKGSRRRVKKSSHSVSSESSDNSKTESTDLQTVNSPENRPIQRKRSQAADNTEREQTKKPKRSKAQSSSSKSLVASNRRGQTANKKATKTTNDNDNPVTTGQKRNEKFIQTGSLSSSESEGSLHLADESDSLTLPNSDELYEQSDREFLQQQIKILKTPFHLEEDCPALSRIKANDSKHIPLQVIQNTLRKVNHKTEDELLRSLNRLAQRKLLDSLRASRPESTTNAASHEQLKRHKEVQIRVANLEEAHHEVRQEHAQYKSIGALVSQLEAISEEFNSKKLMDEIQKTNEFVVSSSPMTTSKDRGLDSHTGAMPGVDASDYIPSGHEQLVKILFKD